MNTTLFVRRPLLGLPFLAPSWPSSLPTVTRRHAATARRTRKKLRVKPEASFRPDAETQDHIVFNPPSSAPSVFHTPLKFLPPNDRRRQLYASAASLRPASDPESSTELPPAVRTPYEKKYHLTQDDMEEMRRLRREDPQKWTRAKLSEKFQCSYLFVGLVCQAPKEKLEQQAQDLDSVKARWGPRKRAAREDRTKRRQLWGRDE